jgi:hypothetical protein
MADSHSTDLSKLRIDRSRDSEPNDGSSGRKYLILFGVIAVAVVAAFLLFIGGGLSSSVEVKTFTVTSISPAQADGVLTACGYFVAQRQAAVASNGTGRL